MTTPPRKKAAPHLRPSDLRGIARLATEATLGVTRIAEGVHQSVLGTLGMRGRAPGQTGGLAGLIYQGVQGITRGVGKGLDLALGAIEPLLSDAAGSATTTSRQREAVIAALNGVMGDRLVAGDSPFATPMSLRRHGEVVDPRSSAMAAASPRILLMIHGLCMNDLQWQTGAGDATHDHGEAVASALGYTPVYLRYNTGLHTSQNGHELARQLEQLIAHWPVPVQELSVLVHSMGGLVMRSAVHAAQQQAALAWPSKLKHIVFLGTPHHGAPLERAGHGVDLILGGTPWTKPFTRLARLRSAGITDLRHGHVRDEDWQGHDRFERHVDTRQPLPLPAGVACHAVAATTAAQRGALADRLIGDGLVPLHSALGIHPDPQRGLAFPPASQWIAYKTNHMALLSSRAVCEQVLHWMTP